MGSFKASPSALGASATVTNITVDGDLTLDDGGSIKEAGGTAAITIDASGNVTKIGQDSPSTGEFLKYDGAKWVSDSASSSGASTSAANTFTEGQIISKDTDGELVALKLKNESDANNTTGIVSLQFDLEDTGGNAVDAAKIAVKKEAAFTATAATQDSNMVFSTSLNGTLTEQMTLDSAGTLTCDAGVTVGSTVITDDSIVMTPSSGDTATIAAGANGTLTITTVDTAAAAANVGFVVDGAFDIDAAGAVTIDGSSITIGGDTDVAIDVDASTLDIDASGALTLDGDSVTITSDTITITSATSQKPTLELKNTTASDSNDGAIMSFTKAPSDDAGEADDNVLGGIKFNGIDSGNAATTYGQFTVHSSDKTGGDEAGEFRFKVMAGGTAGTAALAEILTIGGEDTNGSTPCEVIVNEASIDCDFRVESGDETHMLFVDAANNRVSIGDSVNDPAATLEITNNATAGAFGVPLLQLNSNDTDKIAVDINAANIDANVLDVTADAVTTANVLDVTADGLTTGGILNLVSDSDDNGTRSLVTIHNNNTDGVNATLLDLKQDAGAAGIFEMMKATGGANGAAIGLRIKETAITLSTSGAETTSNNFFPANAIPLALHILVTTQVDDGAKHITKIGTTAVTGLFGNTGGSTLGDGDLEQANDNLTFAINAGNDNFSGNGGITSAQNLVITCNSTPSAGAVRATLFYYQLTVDTSA
jgi:hypothetical protein